jgi:ribosomal protein S18 acetylase RimI-like enzyme
MALLLDAGRARGAGSAWVATETDNDAANGLYTHMGSSGQGMVYYEFDLHAPTKE